MLKTQSKSRLVGANCPGIISPIGRCRIGFQPLPCYMAGPVGVVAKSGTLSYETVGSLTRAGVGQSLCISMGGDVLAGTNFVDALKIFEHDTDTEAMILVGEIGGVAEMDAAEWIQDYRSRVEHPKYGSTPSLRMILTLIRPIVALIGGIEAPPGRVMGHAGAWAAPGEPDAQTKIKALEKAGVVMVDHPEKFGNRMKTLLNSQQRVSTAGVCDYCSNDLANQQADNRRLYLVAFFISDKGFPYNAAASMARQDNHLRHSDTLALHLTRSSVRYIKVVWDSNYRLRNTFGERLLVIYNHRQDPPLSLHRCISICLF